MKASIGRCLMHSLLLFRRHSSISSVVQEILVFLHADNFFPVFSLPVIFFYQVFLKSTTGCFLFQFTFSDTNSRFQEWQWKFFHYPGFFLPEFFFYLTVKNLNLLYKQFLECDQTERVGQQLNKPQAPAKALKRIFRKLYETAFETKHCHCLSLDMALLVCLPYPF